MILWTIQPLEVWELIQETGRYRCDPAKNSMPEFTEQYDWLIKQMKERIGDPPEGVSYPVWAWYLQDGRHKKPDLRSERWGYSTGSADYVCIEFEIPDNMVLLSDFDAWCIILNNGLLVDSEGEADRFDAHYDSLSADRKVAFREYNWQRVFDLTPADNDWMTRGKNVQATFWELEKSMVNCVRFFKTGIRKTDT